MRVPLRVVSFNLTMFSESTSVLDNTSSVEIDNLDARAKQFWVFLVILNNRSKKQTPKKSGGCVFVCMGEGNLNLPVME